MFASENQLGIEFIDRATCYSEIYREFILNNKPFVLSKNFTETWPCRKLWVKDGKPNWDYIKLHYGESLVPVANCNVEYYNSHPKTDWKLKDYIEYLVKYEENSYPASTECLYMKDWHFCKSFPDSQIYETPIYFSVDWLNEYWILCQKDDYRFVYIGPKGSWTPFHRDVYGSFSWSANIIGRKRWILLPPGEELKLKSESLSLPDLSKIDLAACGISFIDCVQKEGEIIFVPSGWHHQVWNLENTISINHNWFNAANVKWIHKNLMKALEEVQDEFQQFSIESINNDQLEIVLQAHHGMNITGFRHLLMTVIQRRESGFLKTHSLLSCPSLHCSSDQFCNEHQHQLSDLETAKDILQLITDR